MAILWGASVQGVSNKLPTRQGQLDQAQVLDNLGTASGLLLALVGDVAAVPTPLMDLAAKVVEYGAAALTEQQDFPESSTAKDSAATMLWSLFTSLSGQLQTGVEALGGEPDVAKRPAYNFPPPMMVPHRVF